VNRPLLVSGTKYCEISIPNRGLRMLVHFVADEPTKIPAIRAMLEPQHVVEPRLLGIGDKKIISNGVLMVDADLRRAAPIEQIKLVFQDLRCASEKLFVVQNYLHHMVAQALALGATAVVSRPREIVSKLAQIEVAQRATKANNVHGSSGISNGAAALLLCSRRYRKANRQRFRMPKTPHQRLSTGSSTTGLAYGLTTCAAIMRAPSGTAC
jgi:hypothetical protein